MRLAVPRAHRVADRSRRALTHGGDDAPALAVGLLRLRPSSAWETASDAPKESVTRQINQICCPWMVTTGGLRVGGDIEISRAGRSSNCHRR